MGRTLRRVLLSNVASIVMRPARIVGNVRGSRVGTSTLSFHSHFSDVIFKGPLLAARRSGRTVIQMITSRFQSVSPSATLMLVKRKARRCTGAICTTLSCHFGSAKRGGVFLKAMRTCPTLSSLLQTTSDFRPGGVILTPFVVMTNSRTRGSLTNTSPSS